MKKRIYTLVLSLLFSFNISCAMEKDEIPVFYVACAGVASLLLGVIIGKTLCDYWLFVPKDGIKKNKQTKDLKNQIDEEKKIRQFALDKELGKTELHKACECNDEEKVASLLQSKELQINAQCKNSYGHWYLCNDKTALHIACENKNEKIVDLLLSQEDIDLTIQDLQGNTAIHIACSKGNLDIVKKLFLCGKKLLV